MSIQLDYSTLGDYPDYLKDVRGFDESRIRLLCSPILFLQLEYSFTREQFLEAEYEVLYESITGNIYRSKQGKAKNLRRAINYYQIYLRERGDKE